MKTKTVTLLLISFFAFTFSSYASFPVKRTYIEVETESIQPTTNNKKVKELLTPAAAATGKSQGLTLMLALFLGLLAGHRWYLGTPWIYNYFFIFTFGGLGIWLTIDIIRIITKDLGPKNGRYKETFF